MIPLAIVALSVLLMANECSDAGTASRNISQLADEFGVDRRIVFYNGITDKYMLEIIGNCSIDLARTHVLEVTCKRGPEEYVKHYLGLSDNVTYFVEMIGTANVSVYHYRMNFKPQAIIPLSLIHI